MPQQPGTLTIRPDLADSLFEHALGAGEFIALKAAPVVPVDEKGATFRKIAFTEIPTTVSDARAPGGGYNRIVQETTSDTYTCEEHGLEELLDDDERLTSEKRGGNPEAETVNIAAYAVALGLENRWASLLFDTSSTFASYTAAVSTAWSTAASAVPVYDVQNAIENIRTNIGGMPMGSRLVGLAHHSVKRLILNTTDVKNRVNYAGRGLDQIPDSEIARVLGLDEVHFSTIKYNGSAIWTNSKFGVYLVAPGRSLMVPRVAATFAYAPDANLAESGTNPPVMTVEQYREEQVRSDVFRVRMYEDEKILSARCGYVLTSVQ